MKNSKISIVSMALCAFFTVSPSFAMEENPQGSNLTIREIRSFSDLKIDHGSVLFLDIDSTLLHRSSKISTKTTSLELYDKHITFCEAVKQVDLDSHEKLKKAGNGMIEKTEDTIPEILENLSQQNVILIPHTSRAATDEGILKTAGQLAELGYKFKAWNEGKPSLLASEYGGASLRDGILYSNVNVPHHNKGSGVKAVTEELYGKVTAFGFVDDKPRNTEAVQDAMASSSLRGPICTYKAPPRNFDVQKVELIYRHTLKEKFEEHEELFKKHFN